MNEARKGNHYLLGQLQRSHFPSESGKEADGINTDLLVKDDEHPSKAGYDPANLNPDTHEETLYSSQSSVGGADVASTVVAKDHFSATKTALSVNYEEFTTQEEKTSNYRVCLALDPNWHRLHRPSIGL